MSWNYRVIRRQVEEAGEMHDYFSVEEVYYDKEGKPDGYTTNGATISSYYPQDLPLVVGRIQEALAKPTLDAENWPAEYQYEKQVVEEVPPAPRITDVRRRLAYHFLTLPHHEKVGIVTRLQLLPEEDTGKGDKELLNDSFQRAVKEERLEELWHEVESRHPEGKPEPNPFRR